MSATTQIAARLPSDLVEAVDQMARTDDRTRTDQITHLLRIGLAGRQRLAEFERLAAAGLASAAPVPDTSGADHLRKHAELCGFAPPSDKDNS